MLKFPLKTSIWMELSRSVGCALPTREVRRTPLQLEQLEERVVLSLAPVAIFDSFPQGIHPVGGLVEDGSGNLFGMTSSKGPGGFGAVFEVPAADGAVTTIASFDESLGSSANNSSLIRDNSGNLFGATPGAIFEVVAGSGAVTTLASFDNFSGLEPNGALLEDSKGDLFGTTSAGGASGFGTVYELPAGSGTITALASFNGLDGGNPIAGLVEDNLGNLFGTTNGGGSSGAGTVFELAAGSGAITTVASFNVSNGANPRSGLVRDANGNLFGSTTAGGVANLGTVFEIAAGSGAITTLASFNGTDGRDVENGLIEDNLGNLFGTTNSGGMLDTGTVFEVAAGSNTITTLANFNGANGQDVEDGLIEDSQGDLFGTTNAGGMLGDGTVFEVAAGSGVITTLTDFTSSNGAGPQGGMIEDDLGDFYGSTALGGTSNDGTIFKFAAASGTITTLASFNGSDGGAPQDSLAMDSLGDLFGVTSRGGSTNDGTVFELAAGSGTITTLATFDDGSDGTQTRSSLVVDGLGNLFGTTYAGGEFGDGAVFEVAAGSGTIITLASFNSTNGANPTAGLIQDKGGNLFGTTTGGGPSEVGTVFELAAGSDTITTLATFDESTGAHPVARLVEDSNGNLFGTTQLGGAFGDGTVFEVVAGSGAVTTLVSFRNSNGAYPETGLVLDRSGNLFGTTSSIPLSIGSTIFEVAAGSGTISTLASFGVPALFENQALTSLVEDASGNFFFANTSDGPPGDGTIDELTIVGPTSSVLPLPDAEPSNVFTVSWNGIDKPEGSGIASYTIYDSDNGGPFVPFLSNTTKTSASFTGKYSHTYVFYSIATDNAGAVEVATSTAQATTRVTDSHASIGGEVFRDYNLNGQQDVDDPGLAGLTVYLDANNNGILDAGELSTTTAPNGVYSFTSLDPGTYVVRQVVMGGDLFSTPASGSYTLTLANINSAFVNQSFADVPTSITVPLTLPPLATAFVAQGSASAD